MSSDRPPVILWFRRDLRLTDNPALEAAMRVGAAIVPVYIGDETPGLRAPGAASQWWLHHSLTQLSSDLEARGARLVLRRGNATRVLLELVRETGAAQVIWNTIFDPGYLAADAHLAEALNQSGVSPRRFNGGHLVVPGTVRTKTGGAYGVFTPFWRTARDQVATGDALAAPVHIPSPALSPGSDHLEDWHLLPRKPDWAQGFAVWQPGEDGAREALQTFVDKALHRYDGDRDRPDRPGTSRLSPHIHFGEISVRAIWRAGQFAAHQGLASDHQVEKLQAELGWREFNAGIALAQHEAGRDLARENYDPRFDRFPWREDPAGLIAWQRGQTGYPIVDAGMRQLWATGWMHNRVRMIVAFFLTKHLMIDWRLGEAWFWDTLVDADHASNAGNWQWVAGSGADASPYFRIFNPTLQGQKFDPDGAYVRTWVPELRCLPTKLIHTPWLVARDRSGTVGGRNYPEPVVEHSFARQRALGAYGTLKSQIMLQA